MCTAGEMISPIAAENIARSTAIAIEEVVTTLEMDRAVDNAMIEDHIVHINIINDVAKDLAEIRESEHTI